MDNRLLKILEKEVEREKAKKKRKLLYSLEKRSDWLTILVGAEVANLFKKKKQKSRQNYHNT